MTERDFCYWLQGFFEINEQHAVPSAGPIVTQAQAKMIREHLDLVFEKKTPPAVPPVNTQFICQQGQGAAGYPNVTVTC